MRTDSDKIIASIVIYETKIEEVRDNLIYRDIPHYRGEIHYIENHMKVDAPLTDIISGLILQYPEFKLDFIKAINRT